MLYMVFTYEIALLTTLHASDNRNENNLLMFWMNFNKESTLHFCWLLYYMKNKQIDINITQTRSISENIQLVLVYVNL